MFLNIFVPILKFIILKFSNSELNVIHALFFLQAQMLAEDADIGSVDSPWRPTCCGCLGASCSTTAMGIALTGSSCPTHGRSQMLRMRTSLGGVGVWQCLLPRTVASVTPAPRRTRTLSSLDARCCCSYGHTRGSQSIGPSSITRRTSLTFTASSRMTGPRWGLSGVTVRYVCERYMRSFILIILFCTIL